MRDGFFYTIAQLGLSEHLTLVCGTRMAEEIEEYDAIFHYLRTDHHPPGLSRDQRRSLRRKAKNNYRVRKERLLIGKSQLETWKQVPRSREERDRIMKLCHALPEGQ